MFSILIIFKNVINQHISMISEDHVTSYDWRKFSFAITENAPVTIVTSVPWEREQDITENSPLWELLPFQHFWCPFGSRQSKWLANCREVCNSHANTDKLRGSINAVNATITSESDTERCLAGGAVSMVNSRCLVPAVREPRLRS